LYTKKVNDISELAQCQYFTTNLLYFDKNLERNYTDIDSFIVLMAMEGEAKLIYEGGETQIKKGETVLLPAVIKNIELIPSGISKLLESYVP
jgi:mannose-6-phosphate isomerase